MIKMYLKIQDIFTRPNEFLPDMSGGQTEFREDCPFNVKFIRLDQNHIGLARKPRHSYTISGLA